MGAPTSWIMSEICWQYLEHIHYFHILTQYRVIGHFMYVDDILIVHSLTQTKAKEILDEIIDFSPNIDVTLEKEQKTLLIFWTFK